MRSGTEGVLAALEGARRVLWFIDFDGTLVSIAPTPDEVSLDPAGRAALGALARRGDCRVAVVSGRPLAYVRRQVALRGVVLAGNHGLEIAGPGVRFRHPAATAARPSLRRLRRRWETLAHAVEGSLVEDKSLSLTFHYRRVKASGQEGARRAALEAAGPLAAEGAIRITEGKKVVEARPPARWGKGEALRHLLGHWGYDKGRDVVVALGDDETDRDMFRALGRRDQAVFVGRAAAPPEATARLQGPPSVRKLLREAAARA